MHIKILGFELFILGFIDPSLVLSLLQHAMELFVMGSQIIEQEAETFGSDSFGGSTNDHVPKFSDLIFLFLRPAFIKVQSSI